MHAVSYALQERLLFTQCNEATLESFSDDFSSSVRSESACRANGLDSSSLTPDSDESFCSEVGKFVKLILVNLDADEKKYDSRSQLGSRTADQYSETIQ